MRRLTALTDVQPGKFHSNLRCVGAFSFDVRISTASTVSETCVVFRRLLKYFLACAGAVAKCDFVFTSAPTTLRASAAGAMSESRQ